MFSSIPSPVSWLSSHQAGHFLAEAQKQVHSLFPQATILLSLSTQLAEAQRVLDAHLGVGQQHCWAKHPWVSAMSPASARCPQGRSDNPQGTAWVLALRCRGCATTAQIFNPPPQPPTKGLCKTREVPGGEKEIWAVLRPERFTGLTAPGSDCPEAAGSPKPVAPTSPGVPSRGVPAPLGLQPQKQTVPGGMQRARPERTPARPARERSCSQTLPCGPFSAQLDQAALLFFPKEAPDGRFDPLPLGALVQGVLAAVAAGVAGLLFQGAGDGGGRGTAKPEVIPSHSKPRPIPQPQIFPPQSLKRVV